MDAIELRATLETKISKAGQPYQVVNVYLTDTYKKIVFLDESEKEVIRLSGKDKQKENQEEYMPF